MCAEGLRQSYFWEMTSIVFTHRLSQQNWGLPVGTGSFACGKHTHTKWFSLELKVRAIQNTSKIIWNNWQTRLNETHRTLWEIQYCSELVLYVWLNLATKGDKIHPAIAGNNILNWTQPSLITSLTWGQSPPDPLLHEINIIIYNDDDTRAWKLSFQYLPFLCCSVCQAPLCLNL